jgi:hypothetical protein
MDGWLAGGSGTGGKTCIKQFSLSVECMVNIKPHIVSVVMHGIVRTQDTSELTPVAYFLNAFLTPMHITSTS